MFAIDVEVKAELKNIVLIAKVTVKNTAQHAVGMVFVIVDSVMVADLYDVIIVEAVEQLIMIQNIAQSVKVIGM
ncbi:hypothetical protein [Prevotella sp. HCN-7019]|uniref:hypothetical protein n=1 Tax=Prevotella sp. HCN-7019 TaxID=3134668 RepID=UPI0030C19583